MKRVQFDSKTLPYLFLLPQLAVIVIFFYWPSVQAISSSFYLEDPFGFGSTFREAVARRRMSLADSPAGAVV